jgi:hypothetical protein
VTVPHLGQTCVAGAALVLLALGVGSRSASAGATPTCAPSSLAPAVITNGAGGKILISAGVRNTGPSACVARARITLALRDAKTRRLLRIDGNPNRQTVSGRVRTGKHRMFTLVWSNYCGPGKPVVIAATLGTQRASEHHHYPGARCETADVPSTLRVFRIRR